MKRIAFFLVLFIPLHGLADVEFTVSTLDTGVSVQQSVAYGYFTRPDRAELVIARIDAKGGRLVTLHAMDEAMQYGEAPIAEFELPGDVVTFDVGHRGGHDILVLFTATRAIYYDPIRDTVQPLVSFSSIYNNSVADEIPRLDLFRDVNDDGLDDFVIPAFHGYEVFIQRSDGSFAERIMIDAPAVMEMTYNNYPWYKSRVLFHTDMTLDGRNDLVFWLDGQFVVYPQLPNGDFAHDAILMQSNILFEYDGVEGVSFRMGEEDQSNLTARALHQLRDLDGDGLPDLVTLTVVSKGVFNKKTTYEFHSGFRGSDGHLAFSELPTSIVESKGIQFEMEEKDLNLDGQMDIVVSSVQMGLGKIVAALITGSVDFDLSFYQMEEGKYPERANADREVTASFNLSSGDVFFPFVLIADVNGDPFADLLVQDGTDTIRVYEGEAGDRLFSRRPVDVKVPLPSDADLVELGDLNNDGKQDVIMRLEKKNKPNRVSVLIAR